MNSDDNAVTPAENPHSSIGHTLGIERPAIAAREVLGFPTAVAAQA